MNVYVVKAADQFFSVSDENESIVPPAPDIDVLVHDERVVVVCSDTSSHSPHCLPVSTFYCVPFVSRPKKKKRTFAAENHRMRERQRGRMEGRRCVVENWVSHHDQKPKQSGHATQTWPADNY